jgi:H+/gluconate symporter-like permease
MWTGDDTLLVIYAVIGVAVIVGLITSPLNQYFGMTVKDTLKTWSVMETLISTSGFAFVLLASVVV